MKPILEEKEEEMGKEEERRKCEGKRNGEQKGGERREPRWEFIASSNDAAKQSFWRIFCDQLWDKPLTYLMPTNLLTTPGVGVVIIPRQ